MSEKTAVRDIQGLSEKPVDEVVKHIADTAPPAVADPAASGAATQEIVEAAFQKYNAQYLEDVKAIQEKAEARQAKLVQEGLASLSSAPKAPIKEVQGPLDELGDPLEMEDASNIKVAQMVWQMAIQKSRTKAGFEAVAAKLGKDAKDVLPLTVGNVALSADMSKVVTDAYPDLTAMVWDAAKLNPGRELMVEAGYSEDVIKKIPQDVLDHWSISELHDTSFKQTGPSIVERLKGHKATIVEALGNDHVQRSLKWAGLIVGCATGGIVATKGVKGIAFLAQKLGENPKVVELAKTLEDKSIKFVSQVFKIDEAKVREKVEVAKGVAEQISNSKWATAAKVAAMVGLGVALGNLDFVHDAAMTVAGHTASLAGAALDGATVAADAIGHGATAAASATGEFIANGAGQILHGATVAADVTGDIIVNGGSQILHGAAVAGEYVATGGSAILHAAAEATGAPGQFVEAGVNQIAHGAAVAGQFVATGAGQILHGAAVAAGATGEFVATGAGQILHGATVAAEFTGDVIVDAGHATVEAAGIVKDAVVDGAVATQQFAVDTVHSVGTGTAHILRGVADTVDPSVGEQVVADHSSMSGLGETSGLGAKFDSADGVKFPTEQIGSTAPGAPGATVSSTPGPAAPAAPEPAPGPTVHEVKMHDNAWNIARDHLNANGAHATDTQIANLVNKMIEDNPDVLGKNPNLIFEHQKLLIDAPSLDGPQVAAAPVYHGPHHVPHPVDPSPVVHEQAQKAAVDMLQTEALPNGSAAQINSYLNAVTQRDRIVDDGLQIS